MNNQFTSQFISNFFLNLYHEDISYCILRGYENLPDSMGNDIDIFIKDLSNLKEKIIDIIKKLNWNYYVKHDEDGFMTIICFLIGDVNISVIQMDIWKSLNWRGITWCDSGKILSDLRKINGFFVPAKGVEAAITSIKELMGGGIVKEKYYNLIQKYASEDYENFIKCLNPIFGINVSKKLCEYCINADFQSINRSARLLKNILIFKNKLCYIKFSFRRIKEKQKIFLKKPGRLIAFVGPDGSGKTTIIKKLNDYLYPFFNSIRIFHIRYNILPELKTGYGFSSMKGKIVSDLNKKSNIKSSMHRRNIISIFASWFVVLYYTFEFMLGNFIISKARRKNQLILFDRYYYDFFIQPTMRDLIYPVRYILLTLVYKPDLIIHLNADPYVVYSRKQELDIEEINAQNNYILRLIKNIKNAHTINTTSKSTDIIGIEIFKLLIKKIYIK